MAVGIMEFRDGEVIRERIYFGEPWEPPAWRAVGRAVRSSGAEFVTVVATSPYQRLSPISGKLREVLVGSTPSVLGEGERQALLCAGDSG